MPLAASDYQQLILANIGDDGTVAPYMPALWEKNAGWGIDSPYIQYLYTWRDSLVLYMGQIWRDVTIRMPTRAQISLREKFANLVAMQKMVEALISEYLNESQMAAAIEPNPDGSNAMVGEMVTTVTLPGNPGYPDPNSGVYRGDITTIQTWPWRRT